MLSSIAAGARAGCPCKCLFQPCLLWNPKSLSARAAPPHPSHAQVAASGMMVNTMGWIEGDGYSLLRHTIASLAADVVLVVGSDRLHSQLSSDLATSSPGVVWGAHACCTAVVTELGGNGFIDCFRFFGCMGSSHKVF